MIGSKTKQKLLDEIAKFGNVYSSCMKVGVDKATYYRWKEKDEKFRAKADEAEMLGRENIGEVADYALLKNVKDGKQRAIEFALIHNSKFYKQKQTSNVVIVHKRDLPVVDTPIKTFEDLFDEAEAANHKEADQLYIELTQHGAEIPNKPDGTPISMDELSDYEAYIRNWQKTNGKEGKIMIDYNLTCST